MLSPDTPTNFMHSMFPAQPGTYVIDVSERDHARLTKEPVIAWAPDADNPYRGPFPITVHGLRRIVSGAILHPCGMVTDPGHPKSFTSAEEWLTFVRSGRPSRAREESTIPNPVPVDEGGAGSNDTTVEGVSGLYSLELSDKVFKNNSFWGHGGPDEYEFVFTVPGGEFPPKQNSEWRKMKRTELNDLKSLGTPEHTYGHVLGICGYTTSDDEDSLDAETEELI